MRGCGRQVWGKPEKNLSMRGVRERGIFVLRASRAHPPFGGWRKPLQVLELKPVRAQWQGWDWWVGRVCLRGTVQREREREGEEEQEMLRACVCRA